MAEEQDELMNFIQQTEINNKQESQPLNIEHIGPNTRQRVDKIESISEWINIELSDLPHGKFYKPGTQIFIKTLSTKEIQNFSVVNEKNMYDVQLKLNEVLSVCTRIVFADGSIGSYRDIMDGDRDTLTIIIAKASSKNGRKIKKDITCTCGQVNELEYIPANYVYKKEDEQLTPFFDSNTRKYKFPIELNGTNVDVLLAPPTIGYVEDINNHVFIVATKSEGQTIPNVQFVKCFPYMQAGQDMSYKSEEQIVQEEFNFEKLDADLFSFISECVDMIDLGVDEVKTNCVNCTTELSTKFGFPSGVRSLFVIPNAFNQLIRK